MSDPRAFDRPGRLRRFEPRLGHAGRTAVALRDRRGRSARGQGRGRRRHAGRHFPLRRLYFRNDRLVLPKVRLPARPIGEHDGWCDDPRSSAYNRLVRIPNEWSHEKMWREDGLYDLLVVVGYNDDPPEGEWGSAIFLHIARDDLSPTQGCVAFARDDLLELVPLLTPQTKLQVLDLSAAELTPQPATGDDDMKPSRISMRRIGNL